MEGSGSPEPSTKSPPQRGPIEVTIIIGTIEVLECLLLIFVLQTSWTSYSKGNRKPSVVRFLIELPYLKKGFMLSGFIIFCINTILLMRLLLPLEYDDELCSVMLRSTGSTCYNIGMASIYTYLWTRQYFLHSSPVLRAVLPRWLPILSKISLMLTMVAFILPLVMVWLKGNILAIYRDGYCYHRVSSLTLFPALMMGATLLTQTVYTFLFYATLKIHQKANRVAGPNKTSRKLAFRCLCFALVAVGTDCFTLVAINITGSRIPEIYIQLFPKMDLFINMMCMLLCFNNLPDTMKKIVHLITCGKMKLENEAENTSQAVTSISHVQSQQATEV